MKKWSFQYWLLKWQIHRDYSFLLEKALLKAKSQGLEINLGTQYICTLEDHKGRIYLPPLGDGVDVTNLLLLILDDYSEILERYFDNVAHME